MITHLFITTQNTEHSFKILLEKQLSEKERVSTGTSFSGGGTPSKSNQSLHDDDIGVYGVNTSCLARVGFISLVFGVPTSRLTSNSVLTLL